VTVPEFIANMPHTRTIPLIIAHRGASGYLPEHTLEAKAMAHALRADFLEQDLVLTKDSVPIVLHDLYLDTVTDVARLFPQRARDDGRFYAIDFTLEEIRQLRVTERFRPETGQAVFPNRFPAGVGQFRISTLEEELAFIQGLNRSTRRDAGIYPEIKQPAFHRAAGQDISRIVLEVLTKFAYVSGDDPCFLQCFDMEELRRIREELGSRLRLIQLLDEQQCQKSLVDAETLHCDLSIIAKYAHGIGPSLSGVFQNRSPTRLVSSAHEMGLVVHPWTYRADAVAAGFPSFGELHEASAALEVDGVFTDFPDQTRVLMLQSRNSTRMG